MHRRRPPVLPLLLTVALAGIAPACRQEEQPPQASPAVVLSGVPIYPGARPVSSSAGTDAAQAGYLTSRPVDSVASWYRDWFGKEGWQIAGDIRGANGGVNLHAEKAGRPLWLMIDPLPQGLGAHLSIIGAEAESTPAPSKAN